MHAVVAACNRRAAAGLRRPTLGSAEPGTYVLVLRSLDHASLRVGRLGVLHLELGYYAYAGSALGPGGVGARLGRHLLGSGRTHWYIDYLRARAHPVEAWYSRGLSRREHLWSEALRTSPGAGIPLMGFGATDCSCRSHLFFFARPPSWAAFQDRLRWKGHRRAGCCAGPRTVPSTGASVRHFQCGAVDWWASRGRVTMADQTNVSNGRSVAGPPVPDWDQPGILPPVRVLPEEARPGIFAPPN